MCRFLSLLALVLAVATSPSAVAAPPEPPAIQAYDLGTLEQFGGAIYRQDRAAWLATDALLAAVKDPDNQKLVGWIVVGQGKDDKVRFLRRTAMGLEAGYDIVVSAKGAGPVENPTDRTLTDQERTAFAARQTASHAVTARCGKLPYNTVVIKDPTGDGWLVWLLAPSPGKNVIPIGGHYRVFVSADGQSVRRVDALSTSCLTIDPTQGLPPGAKPVGAYANHIISPTPIETHVFLNLLYRIPLYLAAGGKTWRVEKGVISEVRK